LEGLFGKQDEMRGHMLEVELLTLDPKSFDNIQDFFTKFKDLLSQLKAYGVDKSKEEKQMVLTILSKLDHEFSVFVSTFHTVRFASGATWKMPSLEDFIESLTQEQAKLINMGKIKGPRAHALTVHDGSHKYHKSKDKYKQKSHALSELQSMELTNGTCAHCSAQSYSHQIPFVRRVCIHFLRRVSELQSSIALQCLVLCRLAAAT
jgi:3-dehydroquinate synthase class II